MRTRRVKTKESKRLSVALDDLGGKVGKVGWFERSRYDDKDSTPVAFVAAQNEYGNPAKNIPPRPFMRPTVAAKKNDWANLAEKGSRQVLKGNYNSGQVLDLIGQQAVGDIKKTISQLMTPVLSPVTIAARLSKRKDTETIGNLTKPLIDTGIMFNTITNTVEDE